MVTFKIKFKNKSNSISVVAFELLLKMKLNHPGRSKRQFFYRLVASRHDQPIDAEQGSFFVHAATTITTAAWTDGKGNKKNTKRQLLQPVSRLERGHFACLT